MNRIIRYGGIFTFLTLLGLASLLLTAHRAYAYNAGNNGGSSVISTGTFNGSGVQTGDAIPESVNTPALFLDYMYHHLQVDGGNSYGIPESYYNRLGVAFIIESAIHGWPSQQDVAGDNNLIIAAQIDWPTFANLVNQYAAANRINWDQANPYGIGGVAYQNSEHECTRGHGQCSDSGVYNGSLDAHQLGYFDTATYEPGNIITFVNPDGSTFSVRRQCGNVIGQAAALQNLSWSLTGKSGVSTTSVAAAQAAVNAHPAGAPLMVYPGDQTYWYNAVHNNGPATAPNGGFGYGVRWTLNGAGQPGGCSWPSNANPVWSSSCAAFTTNAYEAVGAGADTIGYSADGVQVPTTAAVGDIFCEWIAYAGQSSTDGTGGASPVQCVQVAQPPISTACNVSAITFNPTAPGPNTTFDATVSVKYSSSADASTSYASGARVRMTILNSGGATVFNAPPPPASGSAASGSSIVGTFTVAGGLPAGTYTIQSGTTGGTTGNGNCPDKLFTIAYIPYFAVNGGDITAGVGFGSACSGADPNAQIKSWNNNTTDVPNYFGAGSTIGAWASGHITNFVTGMGLGGNPSAPSYFATPTNSGSDLAFANTGASPPNYGGQFGANSLTCMTDYYSGASSASAYAGLSPSTSGSFATTGNVTIGNIAFNAGTNVTLYVKGNVYINGPITYNNYTLTTVPRFNLYVEGNIYIDPSVQTLHGVYIAQRNDNNATPTTGIIVSCASSITSVSEPYGTCNKQLTIVGAMAAEGQLRLTRTHGNLTVDAANGVPAEPAEVFQYSPELWLNTAGSTDLKVKAYTSLPPVL